MLNITRFQLRELFRLKTVCEFAKRNRHYFMQAQNDCLVLSEGCREFLKIVIVNIWMGFHDNPRLRSIHACPPRSGGANHPAMLIEFLGVLSEIPDISISILCEIVERILLQHAIHKNSVVDYPTGYSVDDYRSVRNRKLISLLTQFLTTLVNKSNAWWQREKRIVDYGAGSEIIRIDVIRCSSDCEIEHRQRECSGESSYGVLSFHIHFPAD